MGSGWLPEPDKAEEPNPSPPANLKIKSCYVWKEMEILIALQDVFKISLGFLLGLLAFNCQEAIKDEKESRKALRLFFQEIRMNLISCGVMLGSEEFKLLDTDGLSKFKLHSSFSISKAVAKYMIFIEYANSNIMDCLNFERFYKADSKNRTQENEKTLHAKRYRVSERLKDFQGTMGETQNDLKPQLKKWRINLKS